MKKLTKKQVVLFLMICYVTAYTLVSVGSQAIQNLHTKNLYEQQTYQSYQYKHHN